MKLHSLEVQRLPGIRPGFKLADLAPGVNVIVGPNASGKTSLLRALRAALYQEEGRDGGIHVEATFDEGGGMLRATRLGPSLLWMRDGRRIDAPPLPDHRFLACYTLRIEDLLAEQNETDSAISERLARELAGGYDIRAVRDNPPYRVKANHGRQEAKAFREADQLLRTKQRDRQNLQGEEERLEHLANEKAAADEAGREAEAYSRALTLLEARRRRLALEAQQADYPDNMDRLRGDERKRLDELHKEHRDKVADRERTQAGRDAAERDRAESGLAETDLDEAVIKDHQRESQRLQELESEARQHEKALRDAQAELIDATEVLGGEPGTPAKLDPGTLAQVERELDEKRELDGRLRAREAERKQLPAEATDPEPLRNARNELLHWLAAPRDPARTPSRIAAVAVLLLSAVIAIGAAAATVHWAFVLIAAPLAWGVFVLLRRGAGARERHGARERFRRTGTAEPDTWEAAQVEARLDALDREVQQATRQAADFERRTVIEGQLADEREQLDRLLGSLEARAREVGFEPRTLDASFERWLRLVAEYDRASVNARKAKAAVDRTRDAYARLRDALLDFLRRYKEAPDSSDPDAAAISDRLARLTDRTRDRDDATRRIEAAERELERVNGEIERSDERIREVFTGAGLDPGDEATLNQRLARRDDWKTLMNKLTEARATERERAQDLGKREDLEALVEANDENALRGALTRHEEQAERSEAIRSTITRIETWVDQASHERALERARAERQIAEDALWERLDEALFAEAGRLLLEEVEAEHQQASQPAALHRARAWFARFTRHQFELVFDADGESRFAARETSSGERRQLAELSSGTRMQLLLAVRIAFAIEAEQGRTPLPLILDEALTTADPERFRAAAGSLRTLAEEDDRQVFYLTAQPGDAAYWHAQDAQAHCIDLAHLRHQGRAITDPDALALPPRREVPAPAGHSPESYAVALGVPPVDLWTDVASIHVYHLLRDDLPLLHRLLDLGVERLGTLRALLDAEAGHSLLGDPERERLRRRAAGAEAWIDAGREGRGRPVDRRALEASGAVSDNFIDRVAALAEHIGGDAKALIQALADGEVPRFHGDKREQLDEWLREHGYLDTREPLSAEAIAWRVAAVLQAHTDDPAEAQSEARLLADSLTAGTAAIASSRG